MVTAIVDPYRDYVRALDAAMNWLRTASETHSARHLDTALICTRIARERFDAVMAARLDRQQRSDLLAIEAEAQLAAHVEEMRASIATCRATLARTMLSDPPSTPADKPDASPSDGSNPSHSEAAYSCTTPELAPLL